MLVAGEISGWRHARGVVLVQRGGRITHFAVRYSQKRLRAFNNFLSGRGKIGDKIVSYLQPWLLMHQHPQALFMGKYQSSDISLFIGLAEGEFLQDAVKRLSETQPFIDVQAAANVNDSDEYRDLVISTEAVKVFPVGILEQVRDCSFCEYFAAISAEIKRFF